MPWRSHDRSLSFRDDQPPLQTRRRFEKVVADADAGVAMPASGTAEDDAAHEGENAAPQKQDQEQATSPLKRAR